MNEVLGEPEKEISSGTRRMVGDVDLLGVLSSGERHSIVGKHFSPYVKRAKSASSIHYSFCGEHNSMCRHRR